ncbi:cellulose biosynthesis protein BcsN [Aureimonas frigidaquae]|nr:cellulose biosynthesis protein BcsN [Aureimonas frigidaquae]
MPRPAIRLLSHLSVLCAGLLLAGCMTGQPDLSSSYRFVPPEGAFALPPPGGPAVVSVIERRYTDATEQKIVLETQGSTTGENYLLVQFFGPVGNGPGLGDSPLNDRPLRANDIAKEIRAAMPGVPMQQSASYVQNRFGTFSYAVGRSASGDICLYGWQRIVGRDNSTLILRAQGTIQLRLRLCAPNQSEEQLLLTMYGYSINAYFDNFQWNPYGSPKGPSEDLGRPGEPMYPVAAGGFESVLADPEPAPPPRAPARRASPQRVQAVAPAPVQAEPLPAPIGTPVPPPPPVSTAPAGATPGATQSVPSPAASDRPSRPLCLPHASGEGVVCQ